MVKIDFVTVLSAWLTPTVAIVGLIFAGLQCWLAFKKRKDDLFNKRWDFYCKAKKQFISEFFDLIGGKEIGTLEKSVKNWIDHYADEARFLFGPDIESHVRSLPDKIVKKKEGNVFEDPVRTFRKPFEKYLGLK